MKKGIAPIFILIAVLVIGGFGILSTKVLKKSGGNQSPSPAQTSITSQASPTLKQQETKITSYEQFFGQVPVCQLFPKEKIEELTGKQFLEVKPGLNQTQRYTEYYCEYRQEKLPYSVEHGNPPQAPKNISIAFVFGNIDSLKEVYKLSKEKIEEDKEIPFSHHLVYNENGKFLRLEAFLSPNVELIVNTWWSTLSQDEAKKFVKDFALYLKDFIQKKGQTGNISPTVKIEKETGGGVPLPQDEDIIRNFVALVEEGKADKAALMIKVKDDSELQTWAVHFNAINSFKFLKMEKTSEESWTDNKHIYKVVLDVVMNPSSASAPIPYYGWQNGENIRWITLEKVGGTWKIAEIATGP
jgi:hypothetical protein